MTHRRTISVVCAVVCVAMVGVPSAADLRAPTNAAFDRYVTRVARVHARDDTHVGDKSPRTMMLVTGAAPGDRSALYVLRLAFCV